MSIGQQEQQMAQFEQSLGRIERDALVRIESRRDVRIKLGWDERNSGEWMTFIGGGFALAGLLCLVAGFSEKLPYAFFQMLRWLMFVVNVVAMIGTLRTAGAI